MSRTSLAAALAFAASVPAALGQDVDRSQPYVRDPAGIAQAAALARVRARAEAIAAHPGAGADAAMGDDPDAALREDAGIAATDAEDAEAAGEEDAGRADDGSLEHDLAMVRASLAAAAPGIAADLDDALFALAAPSDDAGGRGADLAAAAERAAQALAPSGGDPPARTAALIAELLLDDGGVAESYEEAVRGERETYTVGWAALQRVKALWAPMRAGAGPQAASDIDASLSRLDAMFPTPGPPERLSPDPEAGETDAQAIVGLLEVATAADLYPGRDLGTAVGIVEALAAEGCARRIEGSVDIAAERIAIASAYYARLLEPTLQFVAAGPAAEIAERFAALRGGAAADDCAALADALEAARAAVSPQ